VSEETASGNEFDFYANQGTQTFVTQLRLVTAGAESNFLMISLTGHITIDANDQPTVVFENMTTGDCQ